MLEIARAEAKVASFDAGHLSLIDGLRGVAVLGVIWHHRTFIFLNPSLPNHLPGAQIFPFLTNGWQGVNLFFFLSGFVLSIPYLRDKREFTSRFEGWAFYKRRAHRLLPLFYAVCFVSFLLVAKKYNSEYVGTFLVTISLLFPFNEATFFPSVNWVFWSLGVEIWFSILFPFIFIFFKKSKIYSSMIIISISLLVRIIGHLYFEPKNGELLNYVSDSVFGRLDDFLLGIIACYIFLNHLDDFRNRAFALLGIGGSLILASCVVWNLSLVGSLPKVSGAFAANLTNVGILLVTIGLLAKRSFLNNILEFRLLTLVGLMCYSIYAWHGIVMNHMFAGAAALSAVDKVILSASFLVGLTVLSFLSFCMIEFPGSGVAMIGRHFAGWGRRRAPSPQSIQSARIESGVV